MNFFLPFSIGLVTSQVLLSLTLLSRSRGSSAQQRLYGALLIGIECYFLVPLTRDSLLHVPVVTIEAAVPCLLWLFSASLFDDHFRFRWWQLLLLLISAALPSIGVLLRSGDIYAYNGLLNGLAMLLKFSFLGLVLWEALQHWHEDLIDSRRQLRFWFCLVNGLYMFVYLFWRDMLDASSSDQVHMEYFWSALVWVSANGMLQQFVPGLLLATPIRPLARPPMAVDPAIEPSGNVTHPEVDTVDSVAAPTLVPLTAEQREVEIPEHVLRTIINGELGYRNFKDFLNGFRIREANRRLADPAEAAVPILTIALDAGFRSLSTFNRVFKITHGLTPSAYRSKAVGD
jgi:Helix-turn-helix domain